MSQANNDSTDSGTPVHIDAALIEAERIVIESSSSVH